MKLSKGRLFVDELDRWPLLPPRLERDFGHQRLPEYVDELGSKLPSARGDLATLVASAQTADLASARRPKVWQDVAAALELTRALQQVVRLPEAAVEPLHFAMTMRNHGARPGDRRSALLRPAGHAVSPPAELIDDALAAAGFDVLQRMLAFYVAQSATHHDPGTPFIPSGVLGLLARAADRMAVPLGFDRVAESAERVLLALPSTEFNFDLERVRDAALQRVDRTKRLLDQVDAASGDEALSERVGWRAALAAEVDHLNLIGREPVVDGTLSAAAEARRAELTTMFETEPVTVAVIELLGVPIGQPIDRIVQLVDKHGGAVVESALGTIVAVFGSGADGVECVRRAKSTATHRLCAGLSHGPVVARGERIHGDIVEAADALRHGARERGEIRVDPSVSVQPGVRNIVKRPLWPGRRRYAVVIASEVR